MITVHLLTKNNSKTIKKSLESVNWADKILIADLGSNDGTIQICEAADAEVFRLDRPRNEARNFLIEKTTGPTIYIEPWEIVAQGHKTISELSSRTYASILQQKTIVKEIRAWVDKPKFVNPVYETIEGDGTESDILLYSTGREDYSDLLPQLELWKEHCPTATAPHYYKACTLLAIGKWQQFLPVSEHYMFLDNSSSMPSIMNRYYFSMVQLINLKKVRPALQNLTICLSVKPLMAEFWCLAGDVHYHLTKKFNIAKDLYQNAISLGSKRLKSDKWPMDLSKYKSYPLKMIDSCEKILNSKSLYITQ